MKVSVIIPVYNKAAFVGEALESVFQQTHQDLEVICVDDASTDESLAVLRSMDDPRLRIITSPRNQGPGAAANTALDAATGTYIVRLDADDVALPDRVERQVAYMEAHPEVGASGGSVVLFGAEEQCWNYPAHNDDCQAQLLFGVPVSQGASILRRSVVEAHGLRYDPAWPRVGEDWLFWTRFSRVSRFGNLREPVIEYRRGPQNLAHGRDRIADHRLLLRNIFAFFDLPVSDAQLDLHLMALRMFPAVPDAARIEAYRQWLDQLLALNEARGLFPAAAFAARVRQAWEGLFHFLPARDKGAAMAHLRLSGWPRANVVFLAKYRINSLIGRVPK